MGKFENRTVTQKHFGILPSFSIFYNRNIKLDDEKGQFKHFYKFMANNEVFLVANDHPEHKKFVYSDDLLMMVIKGQ